MKPQFQWLRSEAKTKILSQIWFDNVPLTRLAELMKTSLPATLVHLNELERIGVLTRMISGRDNRIKKYETNWNQMARIWVDLAIDDVQSEIETYDTVETRQKLKKRKIIFDDIEALAADKRFVEFVSGYLHSSTYHLAYDTLYEHITNFWLVYPAFLKDDRDLDFLRPLLFEKYGATGSFVTLYGRLGSHAEHLTEMRFSFRPKILKQ